MLINTRNFLLYLLCVAFLIIAITATFVKGIEKDNTHQKSPNLDTLSEEMVYSASLNSENSLNRLAKAAELREKINISGISQQLSAPVEEEVEHILEDDKSTEVQMTLGNCSDYASVTREWNPKGLEFSVVEGARLVYRESIPESVVVGTSTEIALSEKEIYLQLPVRTFPSVQKNCIPSDVVGVALDGSLIRNVEYSLYSIFSSGTLIGYALDGFPIYGTTGELNTDSCGGAMVEGEYRYFLSPSRSTVLGCFAGSPVKL